MIPCPTCTGAIGGFHLPECPAMAVRGYELSPLTVREINRRVLEARLEFLPIREDEEERLP